MVHFGLTAYLLAEPSLIANGAYFGTKYSSVSSGNGRVDNIFRTAYILPYAVMFFLMIVFAIFKQVIINLVKTCYNKVRERKENYNLENMSVMVQNMKLLEILTEKQRTILKTSLEVAFRKI